MQTNTQESSRPLERRIDMSVAVAEIDKDVDVRLKKLSRTVKMPGFRPGKVPLKVVARTYEPQVRSEAIAAAVEKALGDAVRTQNLRIAGSPRIEPKEGAAPESLEFSAVFEVYPTVVINEFSDREIFRPVIELGEADVDQTLESLRKQGTRYQSVERPAATGDRVVADFVGTKDGEPFDGGKADDLPFVLGSGTMLKDFDAAVTGLSAGESKQFDLTFPEDYHARTLAGQTVQFDVTLKKVEEPVLPELNTEFAKALGVVDGDLTKLRDEVRGNLQREVKRRIQTRLKDQVLELLLAISPIDVPRTLVEVEASHLAEGARRDLASRGIPADKAPVEASWFEEQATRRVKLGLIMAEIVKKNDLHAKPDQVKALVEELAESYEDPEELVRWYYGQPEQLAQVEAFVPEGNVVKWVSDNAKTVDKPIAFDELMGNASMQTPDTSA